MRKSIDYIWGEYIKRANNAMGKLAQDIGITYKCLEYMWCIADFGECTCTEIATAMGIKKPSASSMINSLHSLECIIKNFDTTDKRSYTIALSPKGQAIIDREWQFYEKYINNFRQYLTDEESATLKRLLDKIADGIQHESK